MKIMDIRLLHLLYAALDRYYKTLIFLITNPMQKLILID